MAQGSQVPVNAMSTVVGINSVVNALFGGHPATVAKDRGTADPCVARCWRNFRPIPGQPSSPLF